MKNRLFIVIVSLSSLFILASCGKNDVEDISILNPGGYEEFAPISLTKAEELMTNDINAFGLRVLQNLVAGEPGKDIVISPLSISLALAMTAGGAEGETAKQMCEVLGFSGYTVDEMGEYYSKIVAALKKADRNCAFDVANSIWISKLLVVKDSFIKTSEKNFASEAKDHIDFTAPSAVKDINKWVEDNTNGKIKDLLSILPFSTKMVLVNALYFNGKWGFEWNGSRKESFQSSDGSSQKVDMMHMKDTGFAYAEDENYQILDLPYGNGAFLFTVILPKSDAKSFPKAVSSLTKAGFSDLIRWTTDWQWDQTIRIPSFKTEYKQDELAEVLKSLGMVLPFSDDADFSRISDQPLSIDRVIHQAFIDVSLSGTEATAATAVTIRSGSAYAPTPHPIEFIADHPFIYAIRESSTGAVIFLGVKS